MTEKTKKGEAPMLYTIGKGWHLDIFIEAGAQITAISLRVFGITEPKNIYNIRWKEIPNNPTQTQIPVTVFRTGEPHDHEEVHLKYEIIYSI